MGRFLEELDYPLESSNRSWRTVVGMRALDLFYRNVFTMKEWAKMHTPLGRFVDTGRLVLGTYATARRTVVVKVPPTS